MWQRWLAILAVAGSIIAVIAWLEVAHLPIHDQHHDQARTEHSAKQTKAHPEETFWQRTKRDPIAVFNLILVMFTGVLAASTVGLWLATIRLWKSAQEHAIHLKSALDISHHTLVSTFRPRIIIREMFLEIDTHVSGEFWTVYVNYLNIGDTDAHIFDTSGSLPFVSAERAIPRAFSPEECINNRKILRPGELGSITIKTKIRTPYYVKDNVDRGDTILYCWGKIQYMDDREIIRRTEFFRRYHAGQGRFASIPDTDREYTQ